MKHFFIKSLFFTFIFLSPYTSIALAKDDLDINIQINNISEDTIIEGNDGDNISIFGIDDNGNKIYKNQSVTIENNNNDFIENISYGLGGTILGCVGTFFLLRNVRPK